jgi:hypothetical protein
VPLRDEAKPVPLNVAASVVHRQLSGAVSEWRDESYSAVLDSTALALSHVADIYYVNAQGVTLKLPDEELTVGMFEAGAKQFRTRSGNVYRSLSMRRGDMADAIAILRKARGAIQSEAQEPAGTKPKAR